MGGSLVLIFGGIVTWMNWQSRREIRAQVHDQLQTTVRSEVEAVRSKLQRDITEQFEVALEQIRGRMTKRFDKLSELSQRYDKFYGEWSLRAEKVNRVVTELSADKGGFIHAQNTKKKCIDWSGPLAKLRVLWVDDHPQNNDFEIGILKSQHVKVDLATSTEEAVSTLQRNGEKFHLVISDMGRGDNNKAGLDMLDDFKRRQIDIPVIIYCSWVNVRDFAQEASSKGVIKITSGTTNLLNALVRFSVGGVRAVPEDSNADRPPADTAKVPASPASTLASR